MNWELGKNLETAVKSYGFQAESFSENGRYISLSVGVPAGKPAVDRTDEVDDGVRAALRTVGKANEFKLTRFGENGSGYHVEFEHQPVAEVLAIPESDGLP